jgi:uncharacterized protein
MPSPSVEMIIATTSATFGAQVVKCIVNFIIRRPVDFRTLVHTGGMPSSHSALVACMTTYVGLIDGFNSTIFAVSLGFAMIIMYDAAGLRRAAGKMAVILNQISFDLYHEHSSDKVPDRLRELLGHTPIEVLAGAIFGAAIACLFRFFFTGHL